MVRDTARHLAQRGGGPLSVESRCRHYDRTTSPDCIFGWALAIQQRTSEYTGFRTQTPKAACDATRPVTIKKLSAFAQLDPTRLRWRRCSATWASVSSKDLHRGQAKTKTNE